ncbi:hypothetical protein EV421DRAFT_1833170 [Armillaria borealis]|uniref:Uncharacterized protein n=1 Tax=Armillaria borealis TaxID=47425 RepID=A0AA39J5Q0_9AGAR|nr:hypothetical protein EV421DRAFT_1833170 [Armillaria borealis]
MSSRTCPVPIPTLFHLSLLPCATSPGNSFLLHSDPLPPTFSPLDTTSDYEQEGCKSTQDDSTMLNILEGTSGDNDDRYPGSRPKQCTTASPRRPTRRQKKQTSTFPADDLYSFWLVPKDISKLQQHEIEAYINEPFKMSSDLLTGYKVVLDPSEWEKRKTEQAEAAASEDVINEVDQLNSKNEEKPKKRKWASEGGTSARKRKTNTTGNTKKNALPKGKGGKKENVESENDGKADENVGTSKKGTSPPLAKKA